jgi:hypothetical protein
MKVKINNWNYNNGWRFIPVVLRDQYDGKDKEFDTELVGWHCWAYVDEWDDFEEWLRTNMKGEYDCTRRFNSGDPMMTLHIKEGEDATLFKLTWM